MILNILIKLHELNNDYPLASDKTEIKKEMLSNYQLKTFIIFLLPMLKNKCLNLLIKKNMFYYEHLQFYLRLGLKLKKYIVY